MHVILEVKRNKVFCCTKKYKAQSTTGWCGAVRPEKNMTFLQHYVLNHFISHTLLKLAYTNDFIYFLNTGSFFSPFVVTFNDVKQVISGYFVSQYNWSKQPLPYKPLFCLIPTFIKVKMQCHVTIYHLPRKLTCSRKLTDYNKLLRRETP